MANQIKLDISETAVELKTLLKKESNLQKKERLQALYLLKSGQVTTLEALSKLLVKDPSTIYRWFQKYKTDGLSGLLKLYKPAGKPCSLPAEAIERLKQKLQNPEVFRTYGDIQLWLRDECGVDVDYYVVYRTVRYKLKAKMKLAKNSVKSSL
ncbi:helix-turn-helix domain-containing protein [Microcoleus sp. FACHB-672]|uniref:helix-turn-helix domain-containing protein n=1 Tax=Microcoleus sp. FACHB-672 TaxID=2692825 RepID=UPI001684EF59|nr:helix-turn-helix domain-containing protein [Microcoleus sp. FACHB-672]MBD2039539.1 helix-turn-helix domain-containing protein [Microcoleus sp. FACHB-672]